MSYFDKLLDGIFLSKKYLFHHNILSYLDIVSNISFILTNKKNYLFQRYTYDYYYSIVSSCISLTSYYSNTQIIYKINFLVDLCHSNKVKSCFSDLTKLYKINKHITEKINKYHNKKKNNRDDRQIARQIAHLRNVL